MILLLFLSVSMTTENLFHKSPGRDSSVVSPTLALTHFLRQFYSHLLSHTNRLSYRKRFGTPSFLEPPKFLDSTSGHTTFQDSSLLTGSSHCRRQGLPPSKQGVLCNLSRQSWLPSSTMTILRSLWRGGGGLLFMSSRGSQLSRFNSSGLNLFIRRRICFQHLISSFFFCSNSK